MNINSDKKVSILIFASGNGSNAENIITYFQNKGIDINWMVITNNSNAGVIQRSIKMGIPFLIFDKKDFYENMFLKKISLINPKLIILAGFLLKISENLIKKFNNKIINRYFFFTVMTSAILYYICNNWDVSIKRYLILTILTM